MKEALDIVIEHFVDYLLPELTPSETALYIFLLRNSFLKQGDGEIRIGKRTIAAGYGKGIRGERTNFTHMTKLLKSLEQKRCIQIQDTTRDGTLYVVFLPKDIPLVLEKLASAQPEILKEDFFGDPSKRLEIFERDDWTCQYCGEEITTENATLDHYIPQSKGGSHDRSNLKACCMLCNSTKSGMTFEEAAPYLLKNIQARKSREKRRT